MHDIANEVGVTRQTIYKNFPNKEAIMCAVTQWHAKKTLQQTLEESSKLPSVEDKLKCFIKHFFIEPFDILISSPDAREMAEGFNAVTWKEIEAADRLRSAAVEALLAPYSKRIGASGMTLPQFANYFVRTGKATKYRSKDKDQLLSQLQVLEILTLQLIGRG